MPIITITLPADGSSADVSDYNGPITTILNLVNGGIDKDNIADGAIIVSKILDGAVASSKLANSAVTTAKIADANVTAAKMEAQQAWQSVTYQNGWADYDTTTYGGLQYYKDSLGIVHLRGLAKSGTVSAVTATLPAGYRPSKSLIFEVISNDSRGRVEIAPTGTVTPGAGVSNTWVSFANISFRAEG